MPTTIPETPSRTRIGNSSRESETVRSSDSPSKPGAKIGISSGARRMNRAVISPEDEGDEEDQRRGEVERLAPAPVLELLGEDRHERRLDRGVGEQAADRVRDQEGDRERRHRRR